MAQKRFFRRTISTLLPTEVVNVLRLVANYFRQKSSENERLKRNQEFIERILRDTRPIRIELGSGRRVGMEDWVSVDLVADSDLQLDLSQPLPFPDDCAAIIYSSHLLEHFSYPKPLINLLAECRRILKPEGVFSVAVPNARIYLNAYSSLEKFDHKKYCLYDTGLSYKARIDYVNYMAYMAGHHRYMFDEENVVIIISEAGFSDVTLREFDPSLDLEARLYESIYVQATKPTGIYHKAPAY